MHIQIRMDEPGVCEIKLNSLPFPGILPCFLRHPHVFLLKSPDPIPGMEVKRHRQAAAVELPQEPFMVREQAGIPRIACPAGTVHRIDIHKMPVHIDDCRCKRHAFLFKTVHQLKIAVLGIPVKTAPPVAERIPRQQGDRAGQPAEILYSFNITMPISEEIYVSFPVAARHDPCFIRVRDAIHRIGINNNIRRRIIDHNPAVARCHPRIQPDRTVGKIQRAGSPAKVPALRIAIMPCIGLGTRNPFNNNAQPLFAERLAVIHQMEARSINDQPPVLLRHIKLYFFTEITAYCHLGGGIFKYVIV